MGEVIDKAAKIVRNPDKSQEEMPADPIIVVRGPSDRLFIIDHHHGARAWLLAGHSIGVCRIQKQLSTEDPSEFWLQLERSHKIHLEDENGRPITHDRLPTALETMPDDPYRTLAWLVRKNQGFCRADMPQKEFAEFQWADFFRSNLNPSDVEWTAKLIDKAVKLAESPQAKAQPGYVGDKPPTYVCHDEND